MNHRIEWTNSNNVSGSFYSKEETISSVQENFDYRRYNTSEGFNVLINGIYQEQILIQNYTNPMNEEREDRKIHFPINSVIKRGSIIENYNDSKWIVLSDIDNNQAYLSAKITECNYNLKWVDENGNIQESCAIIANQTLYSLGTDIQKFLIMPDSKLSVILPNNEYTRKLDRDDRFIVDGYGWIVTNVDRVGQNGIINLLLGSNNINPEVDNMVLGIADYYTKIANYSINILNGNFVSIDTSQNLQLNVEVKNNNAIVNMPLTFTSSDNNIATIDSNGLITPVTTGIAIFTVNLTNYTSISDTITVEIISIPVDNFTVDITGNNVVYFNQTKQYSCSFKNNGVICSDNSIWELRADDGISITNLATIVSQDGINNICTIKANSNSKFGYVRLYAKNNSNTISNFIRIQIKSLV